VVSDVRCSAVLRVLRVLLGVRGRTSGGDRVMNSAPLAEVGQVLHIPEAHYLYGVGTLVLRVTTVDPDLTRYPGLEWAGICGVEIRWDGSDGDERTVMVRVAWLKHNTRPAARA
jgi:hypothetical protein